MFYDLQQILANTNRPRTAIATSFNEVLLNLNP